ncbi:MAG: DUF554 domain-containing protein [Coriobacteriales bacterium]|jgi:uncharacterized membrane protein YqgA involved in biofilm formation|nr:DUF554 domain-containing protein [Coriobacteriales bacterium]
MSGVLLNIVTVMLGTAIGLLFGNLISERFRQIVFLAIGSCTVGFGAIITVGGFTDLRVTEVGSLALLVPVFSLVIGAIVGEALRIEQRLAGFGGWLEKRMPTRQRQVTDRQDSESTDLKPTTQNHSFIEGYMTATILFCVGAMTFLGSIQAGLGDPSILYLKSLLDGISAIALACALGIGVGFSVFSILIIQGGLALLGMLFGDFFTPAIIAAIDLVGGIMLIALGIEIIGIHKMKVANMLPALLVAMVFAWLLG